jgi:cytochrome c oxidase subunit 2
MISNFTWFIHAIAMVVWIGVLAALFLFYRRYRARSLDERGRMIFGHTRLEIAWTATPALIVLSVFLLSLNVMCTVDAQAQARQASADDVGVLVVAHQWWWEYQLPGMGVVTANELHVPVGRLVKMELQSADVQHNWWVPQLQGKIYNIPGRHNNLAFTPR